MNSEFESSIHEALARIRELTVALEQVLELHFLEIALYKEFLGLPPTASIEETTNRIKQLRMQGLRTS